MIRNAVSTIVVAVAVAACGGELRATDAGARGQPAGPGHPGRPPARPRRARAPRPAPSRSRSCPGSRRTRSSRSQAKAQIDEFNATHPDIQVKREAVDNDQLQHDHPDAPRIGRRRRVPATTRAPASVAVLAQGGPARRHGPRVHRSTAGSRSTGPRPAAPTAASCACMPGRGRRARDLLQQDPVRQARASPSRRRSRSSRRSWMRSRPTRSRRSRSAISRSGRPATSAA